MRVRMILAVVVLLGLGGTARAHQASLTHSEVTVGDAAVTYTILISPGDLAEAVGASAAEVPSDAALRAGAARVIAYVTERIAVLDGEVPCPAEAGALELVDDGGHFARVSWTARCPAPITTLVLDYDLFFDLDDTHEAVLRVHAAGEEADTVLAEGRARFVWDLAEPPPSGTFAFIQSGIDHILYGFDHICFLLALLLAIVITRPDGETWKRRSFGQAVRATALIVTSFTVAHSITLIAASLGFVRVSGQLVESVIALSIAYTAIENVVRPDVRWRHLLTFSFGLLHGLGFARMLEVLLPPEHVVVPLLAFNVGVELGQLAIVAIALPAFWLLAGALGAERYRRIALPILSAVLAILGVLWLVERLFDVTILGS